MRDIGTLARQRWPPMRRRVFGLLGQRDSLYRLDSSCVSPRRNCYVRLLIATVQTFA